MKNLFTAIFSLGTLLLSAQNWVQKNDIPAPGRHHPVMFGIDNKGYYLTGTTSSSNVTKDFYEYDAASDSWTQKTSFPGAARSFAIGHTYQGKGYVGFGLSATQYLNDLWVFDPSTDDWTRLADCPCEGRRHPAMVIKNDKIFVGLGDGPSGNLRDWWEYDIASDSWKQQASLPALGRHHPFQFTTGDYVYSGLGHAGNTIFDDWYRYDPVNEAWTQMADFPGEARVAGTQFHHGHYGYVLSGDGDDHSYMPTGEFWRYDDDTDTWTELDPHPGISRWAPGSFVIDHKVYFTGGQNRQTGALYNDLWVYELGIPASVEKANKSAIQLHPNPFNENIFISNNSEVKSIKIFNVLGKEISNISNPNSTLNLEDIPIGIYFFEIENTNGESHTKRLIKN